jgi:flagellar biosynthetic protein FliQ
MTPDMATDLVRQALLVTIVVSGPVLIVGLLVGIVVSIVQAVTQIQEQTLTFVPKILLMLGISVVLMPWICQRLMDFTSAMFMGVSP